MRLNKLAKLVAGLAITASLLVAVPASLFAQAPLHGQSRVVVQLENLSESPIASDHVRLVAVPEAAGGAAQTSAVSASLSGSFSLDPGAWRVRAEGPEIWCPGLSLALVGEEQRGITLPVFRAGTLRGHVGGLEAGESMPAPRLRFLWATPGRLTRFPEPFEVGCTTQAERAFTCAVPAGRFHALFAVDGFVPRILWDLEVAAGGVLDLDGLELVAGASVRGWVAVAGERTLPRGVQVALAPAGEPPRTEADESRLKLQTVATALDPSGRFVFHGVAPGRHRIVVRAPSYPAIEKEIVVVGRAELDLSEPIVLAPPLALDVVVDPPVDEQGDTWRLRVIDAVAPAAERPPLGPFEVSVSGNARLTDLELGRAYRILVLDAAGDAWSERKIVAGDEPPPIVLKVGASELRGEVVLGKDEVPLAATVELLHSKERRRHVFRTDADGRFSGRLSKPGKWLVRVRSEALPVDYHDRPRDLVPSSDGGPIFLRIEIEDGRAAGRVVLTDGSAVAGADVTFAAHGGLGDPVQTTSDDEGRFELRGLSLGEGVLRASKDKRSSRPERVEVREDDEAEEITLTLLDRIEMTLQALSSAGPVSRATFLWRAESPHTDGLTFPSVITDARGEGRISLPADATGLVIAVEASGFAFDLVRVPVAPPTQTITLTQQGGRLILPAPAGAAEAGTFTVPWLFHGSASAPLALVANLARRQAMAGSGDTVNVPNAAPGDYSLCLLTPTEVGFALAGPVLPTARCTTGVLRAGETLELRPPN